jgi:hypothetical protein
MIDLLARGAAWLDQQRRDFAARLVTYSRGSASVTVRATAGRSEFDNTDREGFLTRIETHDEIITVSDLKLDDVSIEPLPGDIITVTLNGSSVAFEVRNIGSEPCWRYTDQYRTAFRIHTKESSVT